MEAFHATLEEVAEADMLVVGGVSLFSGPFSKVIDWTYLMKYFICMLSIGVTSALCMFTVNSALV